MNIKFILFIPRTSILTGYDTNFEEERKSFEIVFENFIDYTLKKKTLNKVLTGLGWELKGSSTKPKKVIAPRARRT